jgi:hypothetical protein
VSLRLLDPGGGADQTVTGRHGEARFVGLAAGRYAYRVQAPRRPEVESADSVQLKEGERLDLTVHLVGANLTIAGRLLNQQGEPVPGIEISAVRHRFASTVSEATAGSGSPASPRANTKSRRSLPIATPR